MSDLLQALKKQAPHAGILLDFDGTVSEIVELPSDARPAPGVREILTRLADVYGRVAIVSGRAAHELVQWLGPTLDIWGVHGAERSRPQESEIVLSPLVASFEEKMGRVREQAQRAIEKLDIDGAVVEDKRVMVGLHYRATKDPERAGVVVAQLAEDLAAEHDLWQARGRMAIELRPPIELSKGDVVTALAREAELQAILFAGDDVVDLPAFDALDRLEEQGVTGLRVAVVSREAPPELVRRADIIVEGPAGMLELLDGLL